MHRLTSAPSEDADQTARMRSLIRIFAVRFEEKIRNQKKKKKQHCLSMVPIVDSNHTVYIFSWWDATGSYYSEIHLKHMQAAQPASVAQLDAPSDWRPGGRGFNPRRGRQHSFVEIDHEIFSTVILSLPLIQEGQLSVSSERMCTILVNRLED